MNKTDAISAWLTEHHPTYKIASPTLPRYRDRWCVIDGNEKMIIEVDYYDDLDSFYFYPRLGRGVINRVAPLFKVSIYDPAYFKKLDELIEQASFPWTEPPMVGNRPLWD